LRDRISALGCVQWWATCAGCHHRNRTRIAWKTSACSAQGSSWVSDAHHLVVLRGALRQGLRQSVPIKALN